MAAAQDDALVTADFLENKTPSRLDGMHIQKEEMLHWEAAELIMDVFLRERFTWHISPPAGVALGLFRRFYVARSLRRNDHVVVAAASFLLACKLEDCPRPVAHIAKVFIGISEHRIRRPGFSTELNLFHKAAKDPAFEGKFARAIREMEVSLLYTVGFRSLARPSEFYVCHKLSAIIGLVKREDWLKPPKPLAEGAPNMSLRDAAWTFMMNSLKYSSVVLRYHPQAIAIASVEYAIETLKLTIVNKKGHTVAQGHDAYSRQNAGLQKGWGLPVRHGPITESREIIDHVLAKMAAQAAFQRDAERQQAAAMQSTCSDQVLLAAPSAAPSGGAPSALDRRSPRPQPSRSGPGAPGRGAAAADSAAPARSEPQRSGSTGAPPLPRAAPPRPHPTPDSTWSDSTPALVLRSSPPPAARPSGLGAASTSPKRAASEAAARAAKPVLESGELEEGEIEDEPSGSEDGAGGGKRAIGANASEPEDGAVAGSSPEEPSAKRPRV